MQRAAVLVGVSRSGDLPKLQAVESGVQRMREWCDGQGIVGSRLSVITDRANIVTAAMIRDAIDALVRPGNLDQLIVYFSGHGIYNRGDLWLLSGAPRFASEAVNVEGSIQLARYCGIDHVVFISDACRVAAASIEATGVTGTEIFPNDPVDGKERAVDAFFACARGKPALEVKDANIAASQYSALYTEVLRECLDGNPGRLAEASELEPDFGFVRPWALSDELQVAVPLRLARKLGEQATANQTPTARISSRSAWISRLGRPGIKPYVATATLAGEEDVGGLETITGSSIAAADRSFKKSTGARSWRSDSDFKWFGTMQAGICVTGAELKAVSARGRSITAEAAQPNSAEMVDVGEPVAALVECKHGRGAIVPVLPGMITELVFESGELLKVIHQPGKQLPENEATQWERLGAMRKQVNAAAETGVFLDSPKNATFITELYAKDRLVDPSVALHAGYALDASGRRELIPKLAHKLISKLDFDPMDLRMLTRQYTGEINPGDVRNWPFLSRAWPMLRAFKIKLPRPLHDIEAHLAASVWTSFNAAGIQLLRTSFE